MTAIFSSKEIHFLKTDSDDFKIKPPKTYFSDLILKNTDRIKAFKRRLSEAAIPDDHFLCAVLDIDTGRPGSTVENPRNMVENFFNSFPQHQKGLWKNLGKKSFIMAFWGYDCEKKASHGLAALKDKLSAAFKTDVLMGAAKFPCHDFSKVQTVENALKAADHAAFFGPGSMVHFDATSLNISADRLYHLKRWKMAAREYQKGLEMEPGNINLINSLGVCFGVMGKLEDARLEFEKALKINPGEVMTIYNTGLIHHINGDIDQAIRYLHKAHGINDSVFEIEFLLGKLLFKKALSSQAIPHLESAARLDPESGLAFRMKGEIYLAEDQPEKAEQEFNKAVKLNPLDPVSLSGYAASMALQDKNLHIALSFAKNSIGLRPDNPLFKERLKTILKKIENRATREEKIKSAS